MNGNDFIARRAIEMQSYVADRVNNSGLVLVSPPEIFSIACRLAAKGFDEEWDANNGEKLIIESVDRVVEYYKNQEKML